MKILTIASLSLAFAFGTSAQPIVSTLTITEQGEGFNAITADYNGIPVALQLTGDPAGDNWTIQLPDTFSLQVGGPFYLGEPEDPTGFIINEISITQPNFLTWRSDVPSPFTQLPFANVLTLFTFGPFVALYTPAPGQLERFQLVLRDLPETAPDSGATVALLGGATALLATLRAKTRM